MEIAEYTPADIGLEWIERIEKCGFEYVEDRQDVFGEMNRIYCRNL